MPDIRIRIGKAEILVNPLSTATATAIIQSLPFSSIVHTWGDEVYFSIPVSAPKEAGARDLVEAGEIAFWVEGQSIAIGFGPTPISDKNEIRLAAATNIWGIAVNDVSCLRGVRDGDAVLVEPAG